MQLEDGTEVPSEQANLGIELRRECTVRIPADALGHSQLARVLEVAAVAAAISVAPALTVGLAGSGARLLLAGVVAMQIAGALGLAYLVRRPRR